MPYISFRSSTVRIAGLVFGLTALAFAANANELNGYMMAIQANAPGIEHLKTGDYRKAITASRSVIAEPGWKAAAHNSMCVSYTILKDYQRARRACAKAVKVLLATKARRRSARRQDTASLGMAYSNRGVLRALTDDLQGANEDFVKAQRYAVDSQKYAHNYSLLQWNLSINGVDTRVSSN